MSRIPLVRHGRSWLVLSLAIFSAALFSANARAAERTLCWKFKAGDSLRCTNDQQMLNNLQGPQGPLKITSLQLVEVRWDVKAVDNDGVASMVQTIERMKRKVETPQGAILDYDSASDKEPTGQLAEMMVPMFKLLVKQSFTYKMNSLGEISDVQLPAELIEGFKKVQGFEKIAPMFSAEGVKQTLSQSTLVLPTEAMDVGKSWQTESTVDQGPLGKLKTTTTFKYVGLEMHDGKEMDKIETSIKLENPEADKAETKIEIVEQEGKGTIYFDNALGRVSDTMAKSKMKSTALIMGIKLESTDETTMSMKYTPVQGAAK